MGMIADIGSATVLAVALALAGCGTQQPEPEPSATTSAAPATGAAACKPGERFLPGARLCESAALALMPRPEAVDEPGCRWVVNETGLPGDDWAVYRSLACKTGQTRLEYAGGAHRVDLVLAASAFGGPVSSDPEPYAIASLIVGEPDPRTAIRDFARAAIEEPQTATGCEPRLAGIRGWPGDALVVDVSAAEAAKAPKDEPRTACGPYGLDEDAAMFWRPVGQYGVWFNLGQDIAEIDAGSFVVVKPGGAISF